MKVQEQTQEKSVFPSSKKLRGAAKQKRTTDYAKRDALRYERSVKVLEVLREYAGDDVPMTTAEVSEKVKLPFLIALSCLKNLKTKKRIQSNRDEERGQTWSIPRKFMAEHHEKVMAQSKEAAEAMQIWVLSSVRSRTAAGIEVMASYPYVFSPVPAESCS